MTPKTGSDLNWFIVLHAAHTLRIPSFLSSTLHLALSNKQQSHLLYCCEHVGPLYMDGRNKHHITTHRGRTISESTAAPSYGSLSHLEQHGHPLHSCFHESCVLLMPRPTSRWSASRFPLRVRPQPLIGHLSRKRGRGNLLLCAFPFPADREARNTINTDRGFRRIRRVKDVCLSRGPAVSTVFQLLDGISHTLSAYL